MLPVSGDDRAVRCLFQEMIEQYVHWNEEIGEWQLRCVAYTGNNMRKQTPMPDKDKKVRVLSLRACRLSLPVGCRWFDVCIFRRSIL